jgi:hypothetical protein
MRNASSVNGTDMMLNMMAMLAHLPPRTRTQVMESVLGQFTSGGDSSRFGLMNALTATARETRDPELRWRLEEFGGGIPVYRTPRLPRDNASLEMQEELVLASADSSQGAGRRMMAS